MSLIVARVSAAKVQMSRPAINQVGGKQSAFYNGRLMQAFTVVSDPKITEIDMHHKT